eukprot:6481133-Amphidinium_carterae.1
MSGVKRDAIPFRVHMLADSSPRSGREWLLAEYYFVTDEQALAFKRAQDFLQAAHAGDIDTEACVLEDYHCVILCLVQ